MAQGEAALAYGCYIQDTTGKLWKAGTWNGSATPNGVAVYDESCSFIIALGRDKNLPINSNSSGPSLTSYNTKETAIADFDGAGNTEILLSDYGSVTTEAAGYCTAYTFPRGEAGYLGSAGEWNTAFKYKDEIDAIMTLVGGDALKTSYLTSTYYGYGDFVHRFWYFMWEDSSSEQAGDMGAVNLRAKDDYTRPLGGLYINSAPPKRTNKIKIVRETHDSPVVGSFTVVYVESQYPVASDIQVTIGSSQSSATVTISEGQTQSDSKAFPTAKILSVTPAEDDKYIYVF